MNQWMAKWIAALFMLLVVAYNIVFLLVHMQRRKKSMPLLGIRFIFTLLVLAALVGFVKVFFFTAP